MKNEIRCRRSGLDASFTASHAFISFPNLVQNTFREHRHSEEGVRGSDRDLTLDKAWPNAKKVAE